MSNDTMHLIGRTADGGYKVMFIIHEDGKEYQVPAVIHYNVRETKRKKVYYGN